MTNALLIDELLGVLSPGRRRLRKKQERRRKENVLQLERLIREYQSLSKIDLHACTTEALGEFDHFEFTHFIKESAQLEKWKEAQLKICEFDLPEMTGGVNPGDQRLIFHLVEYLCPSRVLEIGTHIGASTIHLASALRECPGRHMRKLTSVDIINVNCTNARNWENYGSRRSPSEMIELLQCEEFVQFIEKPSIDFLKEDQEKYDLIFLDGDHSAQVVYREIPLAMNRLAEGGRILLHDYFPELRPLWNDSANTMNMSLHVVPGPFIAVQRLLREGCDFMVEPMGALPWVTKLGSNVTSLALVSR